METQRRRTLVHVNLTHEKRRRHILMAPLPKRIQDGQIASTSPRPTPVVSEDLAIALGSKGSSASSVAIQSASVRNQNAEIVISIKLRNEMSDGNEELKTQGWLEWLRSAPSEAEAVEISVKEHSQFKDFVRQSHESHQEVNSLANARSDVDARQTKHPESTHKSEVEVDSNEIPCKLSDLLETPFEFETSDFDLASGIGDIGSILGMTPLGLPPSQSPNDMAHLNLYRLESTKASTCTRNS